MVKTFVVFVVAVLILTGSRGGGGGSGISVLEFREDDDYPFVSQFLSFSVSQCASQVPINCDDVELKTRRANASRVIDQVPQVVDAIDLLSLVFSAPQSVVDSGSRWLAKQS